VLLCGQSAYLFDGSVQQNFAEYYNYRDLPPIDPDKANAYLNICSARVGPDALCATMSGGERQRVFIAICLSFLPKVIMLDEPTSALDDETANAMMSNIKAFCKEHGATLITVSHNKKLSAMYADYTIMLERGDWHG